MQELISLLNEETLFSFLLLYARVLAFVVFMPVFSHTAISSPIRVSLAFYITIFLYPIIELHGNFSQDLFVLSLITEITLGAVSAMFLNIVL